MPVMLRPTCPPRPEALINGFLQLKTKINKEFSNLLLEIHPITKKSKSQSGNIQNNIIEYLGYSFQGDIITVRTSSGCNFNCIFCSVKDINNGQRWKQFENKILITTLQNIIDNGMRDGILRFIDDDTAVSLEYLLSISEIFKDIAKSFGCNTLHRDEYLTKKNYTATTREQVEGVVKDVPFKHIAWITAVVPLMQPNEYKESFLKYKQNIDSKNNFDSLVTVNLLKEYFWDDNGPINYEANENHPASQLLPNIYKVTNGLYMAEKETMLKNGYFSIISTKKKQKIQKNNFFYKITLEIL